jgi:phosphomannomutase
MAAEALSTIFKSYDVRGIVPDQLDERIAYAIGTSLAEFVLARGGKSIVVGRDMRESGIGLARALIAGAMSRGTTVTDLGLSSTDMLYFASGHLDSAAAMLTASHNPAQYNGVKMCLAGAVPIGEQSGLADIRSVAEASLQTVSSSDIEADLAAAAEVEELDLLPAFGEHVRSFIDTKALRPLRIVADTANGMGGFIAPSVFEPLPFELEILFAELDGTFPNHPADPIQPENLRWLQARVRESGADVGLAFDGDADRVFLVDDRAELLSGSLTTAIVAKSMLERHPGATILYNLICSKAVPEVIEENGGVPIRTRVGHSFIKAVMAETGAIFGGEHSGHYYFRDNFRADSGIIAALVVLELISRSGQPLSRLRRPFERYADSGEVNTEVADPVAMVDTVAGIYAAEGAQIDRLDGMTADLGDWWFNLRPSNTEPLLRLNLEASDVASCADHTRQVRELLSQLETDSNEGKN